DLMPCLIHFVDIFFNFKLGNLKYYSMSWVVVRYHKKNLILNLTNYQIVIKLYTNILGLLYFFDTFVQSWLYSGLSLINLLVFTGASSSLL
ncbi:hypothetical protein M569_16305, partial [Genlisea aurea]